MTYRAPIEISRGIRRKEPSGTLHEATWLQPRGTKASRDVTTARPSHTETPADTASGNSIPLAWWRILPARPDNADQALRCPRNRGHSSAENRRAHYRDAWPARSIAEGTLCRLKLVRHPAVSSLGGGAARGSAVFCEAFAEQPASSATASRTGTATLITNLDAAARIFGAVPRIKRCDEPADGEAGAAGGQTSPAAQATGPPPLALGLDGRPLAGRGRVEAVAAPLLDLSHRRGLPGEGRSRARPLSGPLAGQAAAPGRVRDSTGSSGR